MFITVVGVTVSVCAILLMLMFKSCVVNDTGHQKINGVCKVLEKSFRFLTLKSGISALRQHVCDWQQQLFDAVARKDIRGTFLVLAHSTPSVVNLPYSDADLRTPLHIAAAIGNVVLVQLLVWVDFSCFWFYSHI